MMGSKRRREHTTNGCLDDVDVGKHKRLSSGGASSAELTERGRAAAT
jgi:hypothetical protein